MNLRYDLRGAAEAGRSEHPSRVVRALGIEYDFAEPMTIGDCIIFFDCAHVPDPLPPFLTELVGEPS